MRVLAQVWLLLGVGIMSVSAQQKVTPSWTSIYDGSAKISYAGVAIVADGDDNVYVAASREGDGRREWAILELNATGDTVWTHVIGRAVNLQGAPRDIALGTDGYLVIVGAGSMSGPSPSDTGVIVAKVSASGADLWITPYYHAGGRTDGAQAVCLDGANNVYVAGSTFSYATDTDYLTLKLNANGTLLWAWAYDGPGHGEDHARAIAVDQYGNVYVHGDSDPWQEDDDYLTIKYNSGGTFIWGRRFSGESGESEDNAGGMALDQAGNVYVTGSIETGSGHGCVTLKYTPGGVKEWEQWYEGPGVGNGSYGGHVLVDGNSNIVVVLGVDGSGGYYDSDIAVVKYGTAGNLIWQSVYGSPDANTDRAYAAAIDGSNSIYITGSTEYRDHVVWKTPDYLTLQFDSSGTLQWARTFSGPHGDWGFDAATDIAVRTSGGCRVTGRSADLTYTQSYERCGTVAYSVTGEEEWSIRFWQVVSTNELGYCLAVTPDASVAAGGSISPAGDTTDYLAVQYRGDWGDTVWSRTYDGTAARWDRVCAIVQDSDHNVFVTGVSWGVLGDITTIKYSSTGTPLWTARFDGAAEFDIPTDIGLDSTGDVVVVGTSYSIYTWGDRRVVIKYDGVTGAQEWAKTESSAGCDSLRALAIAPSGDIYVAGGGHSTLAVAKYNSVGDQVWVTTYAPPSCTHAVNQDIAFGLTGDIFVVGNARSGSPGPYDVVTARLSAAGDTIWTRTYSRGEDADDFAIGIGILPSGNIVIGGTSSDNTSSVVFVRCYSADGDTAWTRVYDPPNGVPVGLSDMVQNSAGDTYLCGSIGGASLDFLILRYTSSGDMAWSYRWDGNGHDVDSAVAIGVDGSGNCYVAGRTYDGRDRDLVVLRYNSACCSWVVGDVNMAGIVDLSDLSSLVSYLTGGGFVPPCFDEANVDTMGVIDLSDLTALVSYLTGGGYVLPYCP